VIAAPPLVAGGSHDSVTVLSVATARSDVTTLGIVRGIELTTELNGPVPAAFLAATRKK
jgi:hypothetical protein